MTLHRDDGHRSSKDAVRVVQRRMKVARLLLDGIESTVQITLQLGMEYSQRSIISQDKKWILHLWRKTCIRDVNEIKSRLVARLWHTYSEAMAAWHTSKKGKEVETMTTGGKNGEETTYRIEGASGDPSHLANARAALVELGKLHGLYTEKVEAQIIRQLEGWDPVLEDMTDQELAVLEVLSRRMKTIESGSNDGVSDGQTTP
jgi:hypothetical protein